jgi:hypothetical protein
MKRTHVNVLIVFIFGMAAYAALGSRPQWPFVSYSMYARQAGQSRYEWFFLEGVGVDGKAVALSQDGLLYPFNVVDAATLVKDAYFAGPAELERIVHSLVLSARVPLRAIRVYRLGWDKDHWPDNYLAPEDKTLVKEFR